MARVFISYRRADGQYAVGWIEERLRRLYPDDLVDVAFRDSDLQLGQDFPERLASEVDQCDVFIAVIGERWRGDDDAGPARILDPADWVGREITSALEKKDRLIIPVLLTGVEPPLAGDLHPDHADFANRQALHFNVREDLEELVRQVGERLTCLRKRKLYRCGLDKRLPPISWRPTVAVIGTAVLAAVAGVLFSWFVKDEVNSTHSENLAWRRFSAMQAGYWFAAFVIGCAFIKKRFVGLFDVDWKDVVRVAGISLALVVVAVTSYAPGDNGQLVVTFVEVVGSLLLLSPWILALIGASWTKTNETGISKRAVTLMEQRHALGLATAVLVVAVSLAICTNATLLESNPGISTGFAIVGFGVFLSALLMVGVEYGHAAMRETSDRLRVEITNLGEIAGDAQKNMEPAQINGRGDLRPRIALLTTLPALVAIITALVVLNVPPSEASLIGEVIR